MNMPDSTAAGRLSCSALLCRLGGQACTEALTLSPAAGQHRYQAAKAKQYGDIFKLHCYQARVLQSDAESEMLLLLSC